VHGTALLLIELGGVVVLLAASARLAHRLRMSPIPLYLLAGLLLGEGGLLPIVTSEEFIATGADIGVVLLLLMLGLEYTGSELLTSLRTNRAAGIIDLVLNSIPGVAAGLILGFGPTASLYLGGVTYISSSGVVAKLVTDLGWMGNRETPVTLSILVFEDLAMAVLLPVLGALALGASLTGAVAAIGAAILAVIVILAGVTRYGERASDFFFSRSDEVNLLSILGVTLLVAGVAEGLSISAAVGAFLVGIGVSGRAADRARTLLSPLRDLFAGVFFLFFGLMINPQSLTSVVIPVVVLSAVTGATKYFTGVWAAKRQEIGSRGRMRTGLALLARGEFSIVIAGLAITAGADERFAVLAAGYVLVMATVGPVLARFMAINPRPSG